MYKTLEEAKQAAIADAKLYGCEMFITGAPGAYWVKVCTADKIVCRVTA